MKYLVLIGVLFSSSLFCNSVAAQTEDCRQLSGLPMAIGAAAICGEVKLRGLIKGELRPSIHVALLVGGVQVERMTLNETGYYFFRRAPSDNSALVFEVNNLEVGRVQLAAGVGSSVRRDIEVDMQSIRNAQTAPGVVSATAAYHRTPEADRNFSAAMASARAKRTDEAIGLFARIVADDPKDFVALTELGTLYFGAARNSEAEAAYDRAVELKADFMPALMNLGKLCVSEKKFDKAAATFFKAVTADPKSADAFHYLGETYLQMKQGNKAVIALNEALRLAPTEKADIHLRLATLYNAAGAKDRAANEYKLFLAKVPNHPERDKLEKYIRDNTK